MQPAQRKPKTAPEVVVFDSSALSKKPAGTKADYKKFMSSKISKINAKPAKMSKEEKKEDDESREHDRELKELLEGKLMIEKLHESQLSGKDRHSHNTKKLVKLGMKIKSKANLPANQFFNTLKNQQKRTAQELQDAKDRGILNAAMKRDIEMRHMGKTSDSNDRRKPKIKMGDRGLRIGSGKYKDGVLHISQSHIDRVSGAGKTQGRIGKGKSKGKGKGKGKGDSRGKGKKHR
ncbi:hypothetical protein J3B02_000231 [Coemansia erecta]|uniref:Uncharacterized protein n=1 Tax=Coemansia asiatica TaxID=1052880 RepID=A0A9W7XK46_9FUNG|nr:hypothetical protein LPJ64_003827 [Coemansia asiatica]KAJ2858481.1 hypothetical protein J3B02_000231 [Coemansia erecta]